MIKFRLILVISFLSGISYTQEIQQFQFNVHRFNDSVQVESCVPMNLYNELMTIPGQENNNKQIIQGIPMHVLGSKWVNNCLIINWPNIPNEEIVSYILVFTKLREDQIIIIE
jgi:hypothetical protein